MLESLTKITPAPWMSAPAVRTVMAALNEGEKPGPAALFVGGCVRNTLLGLAPGDIDIATVLPPDLVMQKLNAAGLKAIPTGIDHGTVTGVADGQGFEITTLRRDVATDGRRAVVAFTDDWAQDAQRRDFTMNTLLADAAGNIFDPTGRGMDDLRAGCLIFVGDPAQRIAEDYLRILRFFRFHAWYGKGAPDPAALSACAAAAKDIAKLSRERVTHEILRLLAASRAAENIALMFSRGILVDLPAPDFNEARLAALIAAQEKYGMTDIVARLYNVTGGDAAEDILILSGAQKKHMDLIGKALSLPLAQAREAAYRFGKEAALQACLMRGAVPDLISDISSWIIPSLPVTGDDVMAAGVAQGRAVGETLRAIERWWIDNGFAPDRAACLARIPK